MFKLITNYFFKSKLSREAFIAYFNRLPDSIQVNWQRDGDFIVGKIFTDEKEFMTQGRDADEFVEMVNDAIITVFNVPEDYIEVIKESKTYVPSQEEYAKLQDNQVSYASFGFKKSKKLAQLA